MGLQEQAGAGDEGPGDAAERERVRKQEADQAAAVQASTASQNANSGGVLQDVADSFGPGGFAANTILKNNPIAGTVNAIGDVAQGNYLDAGKDFAQGASLGTVPIPGQTGLVGPVQGIANGIAQVPKAVAGAVDAAGNAIGNGLDALGNVLSPAGSGAPNAGLANAASTSNQLASGLGAERAGYQAGTAPQVGNVQVDPTQIDPLRAQQNSALQQLAARAAGQTPSPAELQAKQQAERAAAQQYGQAAALQGGMSAGGALRQASTGAAQVLGDVANQGQIARANEMAGASRDLVGALSGVRGQEQDLGTANAGLTQQGNLANQNSSIQTTGQDFDWRKALLSGQNTANQTAEQAAAAAAQAEAQRIASENAYKGALIGAGGSIIGNLVK